MPKVPGMFTISGRFLKCGSMHTLMANIAHNPLRFSERFGLELQTRIKRVKKTTNMADVRSSSRHERPATGRSTCCFFSLQYGRKLN